MDNDIISNIKSLAIDMIENAHSGHPGISLDAAPIIYTLYAKHLNINVNDPKWINRDRFIMSNGHGSALLYATLYMAGYDLTIDDLRNYRHLGITPGHPELGLTPGVECTTGPLGEGFATSVGIALAGKMDNKKFSITKKGKFSNSIKSLLDYNVYVMVGDGDIMEGITSEAASLAGTWHLDNLIVLYDSNHLTIDGSTKDVMNEDVMAKFEAMGWYTTMVDDGTDVDAISRAIDRAKSINNRPSIIEINTILGNGSMLAGTTSAHGTPLEKMDVEQLKQKLGVPSEEFFINNECVQTFRKEIYSHSDKKYQEWANLYQDYQNSHDNLSNLDYVFGKFSEFKLPTEIMLPTKNNKETLRDTNYSIMNKIFRDHNNFIVGSADLRESTKVELVDSSDVNYPDYKGANIKFGVRENAMGAILNGLAINNYRPFGSTFLAFSDYMKPSIRMSALMKLPVTYIFTHDSINIGEDGPTHQPIEQLASLRSIPNMKVYRPSDAKELLGCWYSILVSNNNPACLVLPRTEVTTLDESNSQGACFGGYIIKKEVNNIHAILIATGTEVPTAINIANELFNQYKLDLRVVSMPCKESYLSQPIAYQESVIPKGYRNIVIEAGSSYGWGEFVYNNNYLITLDKFGISGTKNEVLRHMEFSYDDIKSRIEKLLLK